MTDEQDSEQVLIPRLKFESTMVVERGIVTRGQRIVVRDLMLQAADEIVNLRGEVDRLRGALMDEHTQRAECESPYGDMDTEWVPAREQIIDHLLSIICPAGEPWTGDDPTADHGHTHCMWVGAAIRILRAEQ